LFEHDSLQLGPFVSSSWTKSIELLRRAQAGGGLIISTAIEQRTLGSSPTLCQSNDIAKNKKYQWRDVVVVEEVVVEDDEEEVAEDDDEARPVWRTDIESREERPLQPPATITTSRVRGVIRTATHFDDSLFDMMYNRFECRHLLKDEMRKYHVVMLPMRSVLGRMRREFMDQGWQRMWRHVEREREKEFLLGESRLNFRKARKHYW
jgi:hypothetical protein